MSTIHKGKFIALVVGALLVAGLTPLAAQSTGFTFRVDPLVLGYLASDKDTDSAKFEEYRDFEDGFIGDLGIHGDRGDTYLSFLARNIARDDGRYTFAYGTWGGYSLNIDYNGIPHRFGNNGHMLYTRTGGGLYEIPNSTQAALQAAVTANQARLNFNFLDALLAPFLANANQVDIGLQRDRLDARFDLGKMAGLAWGLQYKREQRDGTRPYGASFGFNNVTELPEPIDYLTQDAELSGEWNGEAGGLRFGYRASTFENDNSTLIWDNPFRLTSSTDPNAYQSPSTSSVGGSALGLADLAPDNKANIIFLDGRARFGGSWFANGTASYNVMKQDDDLVPYTLNTAIRGINFDHSTFDATNPANLPVRQADTEVDVLNIAAQTGTRFADKFDLTFRYRLYDYDNQSERVEFPGYVRYHAVWEEIGRITVPNSYTRQDIGAEFGWDINNWSRLGVAYILQSWDRDFREIETSDEDVYRLTYDITPSQHWNLRARYEYGDRSTSTYHVEAQEESFIEPEGINNIPTLRKFDQAERNYDSYLLESQWFLASGWSFSAGISGRNEDYDKSAFGLQKDEIFQYNAEVGYAPGDKINFFLFGHRADRNVVQRARQSGSTPSTRPIDDWIADFDENTDTWGLGLTAKPAEGWTADLSAQWSNSDGLADFTAFAGGLPLGSPGAGLPPRTEAQDFDNYEDTELLSVLGRLGYKINDRFGVGVSYLWEDYTIDSFILQGLQNYLPGALLLNANNGDYTGQVFRFDVSLYF